MCKETPHARTSDWGFSEKRSLANHMKEGHQQKLISIVLVRVICFLGFSLFLLSAPAWADTYFNSSEPGCDGSDPTVLMCDDFEDGSWADRCDNSQANDGWCAAEYVSPDPKGQRFGRCGSLGVGGTDCVATSGEYVDLGGNWERNSATHWA